MAYHESYGEMPPSLLTVLKKYRVTPNEYQTLLDVYGRIVTPFAEVERFILNHVEGKRYKAPLYY